MRFFLVLLLLASIDAQAADTALQLLPFANASTQSVLPMPNGSVAIFGSIAANSCSYTPPYTCNQTQAPLLSVLDSSGNQTAHLSLSALGGGNSTITGAALDSTGDIWITGSTDSDDFPLIHPLFSHKPDYQQTGFVAKLDPALAILFSTFLGGQENPLLGTSTPSNIALDAAGNVYVVGTTLDSSFPTTAPVFGSGSPLNNGDTVSFAFVSKISSDGTSLLYSRLLGGDGTSCIGGSCIGYRVYSRPSAVAVDQKGNLTLAGSTTATNFPVSTGAYTTGGGAFVARIAADGSQLIWSTEVGYLDFPGQFEVPSSVQQIALDNAGDVFLIGSARGPISTTSDALQSSINLLQTNGFVLKLSADATQLFYATELGGTNGSTLYGLTLDSAGNAWIAGNTHSSDFPGLAAGPAGLDFALELNANGTALQQIFALIPGTVTQPIAFDSNGNLLLAGSAGSLLRLNSSTASSAPAIFAITNSAEPKMNAGVSHGELLTIYGTQLGPASPITGMPDATGLYPRQLGGVTVQFGCGSPAPVSAPLLYVSATQINLQVPFSTCAQATLTIITPATTFPAITVQLSGSIGIFGALNQDGTVNSPSNPAARGSVVSLYATGLGQPPYAVPDGAISTSAASVFQNIIEVQWSNSLYPLGIFYAGTAPSLINGLDQINVQLPAGVTNPVLSIRTLTASSGGPATTSDPITIYTQ